MKVSGVTITDEQLAEVEAALAGQTFELATFQQALERAKVPAEVSYQAAKRHLQELRRDGAVVFDRDAGIWKFLAVLRQLPFASKSQISRRTFWESSAFPSSSLRSSEPKNRHHRSQYCPARRQSLPAYRWARVSKLVPKWTPIIGL